MQDANTDFKIKKRLLTGKLVYFDIVEYATKKDERKICSSF